MTIEPTLQSTTSQTGTQGGAELHTDFDTDFGVRVERGVPLAALTTMRVGGAADFFATVTDMHQLLKLVRWARKRSLPYLVIGGGSNMLIADAGVRGLVIHNRARAVRIDEPPCCTVPRDDAMYLVAESGAAMAGAARTAVRAGLTGLEWAVSVPGTVGGAVVNNAGAHGGEVKDCLADTLLLDEHGELQEYVLADLRYSYRASSLKRTGAETGESEKANEPEPTSEKAETNRLPSLRAGFAPVVLSANFRLHAAPADEVKARADGFLAHRRRTQPVEPSLGSMFVNPPGDYAGRLIEAAGLKGTRLGGAEVSELHANFIINPGGVGNATAADVLALIQQVQQTVRERCGVELVPEVQLVGDW